MDHMIAGLARLMTANPAATARQFALTGVVGVVVALLFTTFWITAVAGVILLLAHRIGVVPAVFVVAGFALLIGLVLLLWVSAHGRTLRRERQIRAQAQQSALSAFLAVLPGRKNISNTLILAGLVTFALLAAKPKGDPDSTE